MSDARLAHRMPVCGIGVSAGAIEALEQFFTAVSADLGFAYVVVARLPSDLSRILPALMRRWTTMPVVPVGDQERARLAANHVYVVPPDRDVDIIGESVGVSRFKPPRRRHMPIDRLFRSLVARDDDSVAVVLSGQGSDGALGAKAIRTGGGLVLVQDPQEAAHGELPRAVVRAGAAAHVLPVRTLASRLSEFVRDSRPTVPVARASRTRERRTFGYWKVDEALHALGAGFDAEDARHLKGELAVLRQLYLMTVRVAAAPSLASALAHVLSAAIRLHRAERGNIQLFNSKTGVLRLAAHQGFSQAFVERFQLVSVKDPSACGRALRQRTVVQIADIDADSEYASLRHLAHDAGYRAVQSTPLVVGDELVGVLSVHYGEPRVFTERDVNLALRLGRQAAVLIQGRTRQLGRAARRTAPSTVRELQRRLVTVQEDEQMRIARDLHDQLGQHLAALRLTLQEVHRAAGRDAPAVTSLVARATELASEAEGSVSFLTWELRPASLEHVRLPHALEDLVASWSARFHIPADFQASGRVERLDLPIEVALNLYRIVQEALHNVYKHANAKRASVSFSIRDHEAVIIVSDDGDGFTERDATRTASRGFGLMNMRERALLAGGHLDIESAPGQGTTVFVRLPLGDGLSADVLIEEGD